MTSAPPRVPGSRNHGSEKPPFAAPPAGGSARSAVDDGGRPKASGASGASGARDRAAARAARDRAATSGRAAGGSARGAKPAAEARNVSALPLAITSTLAGAARESREALIEACPEVKMIFPALSEPGCFGAPSALDRDACYESLCVTNPRDAGC